jgi:hypothetical protein
MFGDGFLAWIMSAMALVDEGSEMVRTNQVDPMRNITMVQRVFRQENAITSNERPFTILVEGNVGSGEKYFVLFISASNCREEHFLEDHGQVSRSEGFP